MDPSGSLSSMNPEITDWIVLNMAYIQELLHPIKAQKEKAFHDQDLIFHDDIKKQYVDIVREIICIEISKSIACSSEDIYDTIDEGTWEELCKKIL